jgi:hypothetical protein
MPPFGPALGADGTKDVANYVRSLSGLATTPCAPSVARNCSPRTAWPVTVRKPRARPPSARRT